MVLDPLIGPQGNTYVDGVPTDDLTRELDRRADLVYAEVIEERNREEMAVRTTSAEGSSGEGLLRDAQNTSQARARE